MGRVHLDHNATTPMRPEARELWLAVTDELPGNASSLHAAGRRARDHVDRARERVAAALEVAEDEIVFTSGGTEANNLAIFGAQRARRERGEPDGVVTAATEHSSVLGAVEALGERGVATHVVGVDGEGVPDLERLGTCLSAGGVGLVSIAAANNEIGTLVELQRYGELVRSFHELSPAFHTDAVQALGRVPLRLRTCGVDLASFSAHKVGGPPGVGVLWRRAGAPLAPLAFGGGQEHGLRPGTENVAGIAAGALAIELAVRERADYARRVHELSSYLWSEIASCLPTARLLGPPLDSGRRLPNTLNVSFPDVDGKVLVTRLDLEGLELGAGSACASGSLEPSHVLRALGLDDERARSGLRISLGRNTTRDECARAVDILRKLAEVSRAT